MRLQGCYKDDSSSRDLPTRTIFTEATEDTCTQYCSSQGYKYAGLQVKCFLYANVRLTNERIKVYRVPIGVN